LKAKGTIVTKDQNDGHPIIPNLLIVSRVLPRFIFISIPKRYEKIISIKKGHPII